MKYIYSTDGDSSVELLAECKDLREAKKEAAYVMVQDNENKEGTDYKFLLTDKPIQVLSVSWTAEPLFKIEAPEKNHAYS